MFFGLNEEFEYFECSNCGCLQILDIPNNMDKYYPSEDYYSYKRRKYKNFVEKAIKIKRDKYALFKNDFIGKIIFKIYPDKFLEIIGNTKIHYDTKILDVGCGAGDLLYSLHFAGFTNLMGIDPYINEETINNNLKILKMDINELSNENFDLIIFRHSFEHISNPLETLLRISKLLSEEGLCIIKIPLKNDFIWKLYGTHWAQIDAPRHFFNYTQKSFNILLKNTDLKIKEQIFDSTEFQFWGSEQYKKKVPLTAENSYLINHSKSLFTYKDISEFKRKAKQLNEKKLGDEATFILKRG